MLSLMLIALALQIDNDVEILHEKAFEIPFTIEKERRADLAKINLFVSTDSGRTWRLQESCHPTAEAVTFVSDRDGEYWFSVQLVSKSGALSAEVKDLAAQLKVRIDTSIRVVDWHQFYVPNLLPRASVFDFPKTNLFVSTDEGLTWKLYVTYPSISSQFHYSADSDGVYWFATQRVKVSGEAIPDQYNLKVEYKVRVDRGFHLKSETKEASAEKPAAVEPTVDIHESYRVPGCSCHSRCRIRRCR
ncbi:MAG: hypothetical protein QM703_22160 [Gemmatales bacterium]